MNTQSLDLNKMGLDSMQFSEMQEIEGGQIPTGEFVKYVVFDVAYHGLKFLAGSVVPDWNSRTGGQASQTSRTASMGPY